MGVRALEIRAVYAMRFLTRFLCGVLSGRTDPGRRSAAVGDAPSQWRAAAVARWVDAPILNLATLIFKTITAGGQNQGQSQKEEEHDPTGDQ
jgi:hypothetical protein